jgi:hypothetical protein
MIDSCVLDAAGSVVDIEPMSLDICNRSTDTLAISAQDLSTLLLAVNADPQDYFNECYYQ